MKNLKNKLFIIFSLLCALALTSCMDLYDNYDLCTVVFNGNGGATVAGVTSYNQISKQGEVAKLTPNSFISEGKLFLGWSENKDATTADYLNEAEFPFGSDKTLYAIWAPGTFTVTFDGNGVTLPDGSKTYTQEFKYGVTQKLINNQFPESETKGFAGWALSKDTSKVDYPNGNTMSFDKDTTLYAVWRNKYTVTFHDNGGAGTMNPQKFVEGVEQALSACIYTKSNHTFAGWSKTENPPSGSEHDYNDGQVIKLTSNLALYAVWLEGDTQLYVSATGNDDTGTGAPAKPFKTLGKAIDTVNKIGITSKPWNVYIDGSVNGTKDITAFDAQKIIIQKKDESSDATLTGSSDTILKINSKAVIDIKDVKITGGGSNTSSGGAIYINNSDAIVTLESGSEISGNNATDGGAVYIASGKLVINGGIINNNTATNSGGGIYVASGGYLTLTSGSIGADGASNHASNGGGVYNAGGTVNMTGGDISYNTACETGKINGNGGGVYNSSGLFEMSGGTITKNKAGSVSEDDEKDSKGGGIFNSAILKLSSNATIGENITTISSSNCANYSNSKGGGIYNSPAGSVSFADVYSVKEHIKGNFSQVSGGGIYTLVDIATDYQAGSYVNKSNDGNDYKKSSGD